MKKRGQISDIFLYIVTVLIVGLVLILGYKGISSLLKTGEETSLIEFKNDMSSTIKKGMSYGRITTQDFTVGNDYEKICFASRDAIRSGVTDGVDIPILVEDAISASSENYNPIKEGEELNNVFIVMGDVIQPIATRPIDLNGIYVKCWPMETGRISLRFEGLGDATRVLGPPSSLTN